jgi:hypothetical protein
VLSFILGKILWKKSYMKSKRDIEKGRNKEGGKKRLKDKRKAGIQKWQNYEQRQEIKSNTRTEIKTLKIPAMWLCVVWQDCIDVSEKRAA